MSVTTRLSSTGEITAWLINESDSDNAAIMLGKLIAVGTFKPENYSYATINYDCSKGLDLDPDSEKHFVLKFGSRKGFPMIMVAPVTAGYGGSGPHCTLKCLEKMGFILSDEDVERILSKPIIDGQPSPIVNLTFYK